MIYIYKLFLAIIPVLLLLYIVYLKGDGKNIPAEQLRIAFWRGFLIIIPIGILEVVLLLLGIDIKNHETVSDKLLEMFFTTAIFEEACKYIVLHLLLRRYAIQNITHIIVLAAFIGLGFACIENIYYVLKNESWLFIGITRALFSVTAHLGFAFIMGYFYSVAKHDPIKKRTYYFIALLLPICLHWCGNALLMSNDVLGLAGILLGWLWGPSVLFCGYRLIKAHDTRKDMETSRHKLC